MNKKSLIAAISLTAVAAATLSTTAQADSLRHSGARIEVRGQLPLPVVVAPVPRVIVGFKEPHRHGHRHKAAARHHHHGKHAGHRHADAPRYEYPPRIERREVHNDYRPMARYEPYRVEAPRYDYRVQEERRDLRSNYRPAADDNLRIRIAYDLKL